jgi:hypothetical protein
MSAHKLNSYQRTQCRHLALAVINMRMGWIELAQLALDASFDATSDRGCEGHVISGCPFEARVRLMRIVLNNLLADMRFDRGIW